MSVEDSTDLEVRRTVLHFRAAALVELFVVGAPENKVRIDMSQEIRMVFDIGAGTTLGCQKVGIETKFGVLAFVPNRECEDSTSPLREP